MMPDLVAQQQFKSLDTYRYCSVDLSILCNTQLWMISFDRASLALSNLIKQEREALAALSFSYPYPQYLQVTKNLNWMSVASSSFPYPNLGGQV